MKNKVLSLFLILSVLAILTTVASAEQINKIGTGYNPAIFGNMVTWSDITGSIHVYDLTTQRDTIINSSNSSNPAMYGNTIVWNDKSTGTPRLTVYDIPSGTRSYITQNVDSSSIPKIYGNRIVWGSNGNFYLFEMSTSTQTQIAVGSYSNMPDIYDTKVVYTNSDGHICMYDITTKKTETIYSDYETLDCPHIYGNKVVWSNSFTGEGFIQLYDLTTKNTIAVTSDIEWSGNQQMGDDTGFPSLYSDKIVYSKFGNDISGNAGIYVYNITTGQNNSVIDYSGSSTDIYDNTVVWGTGDDIYVCNLSANTEPSLANFTSNVTSGYMPLSVAFTDTSDGKPTSWLWDFGDGTTSTKQNPTHVYYAADNYIVNLTVREYNRTYSKYETIGVLKPPLPLVANFSTNVSTGYAPLTVQFTDLSENATGIFWDFGDGSYDNQNINTMHTYLKAGNYTVTLDAQETSFSFEYFKNKTTTITVLERPVLTLPIANFTVNTTSGYAPLTVQFTDASQNATGWNWDFGDGANSTDRNISHVYSSAGIYNVNLTVSNANGSDTHTATITVQSQSSSSSVGSSSSSSSSGGSSSGSGGSPEPQNNVEVKEISQAFITNGSPVKFDFPQRVTPVEKITFDSKKTVGKTSTIVELLKEKSTLVTGVPSNEVYKYLNVWVGNGGFATEQNIGNAVVTFKVAKSWVQDEKIDKSSIALNRYSDKTWNQLSTSLSGEDDSYLYFTAQTPAFSSFAIIGKCTASGNVQPADGKTPTANVNVTETETNMGNSSASTVQTTITNTSGKGSTKAPGFETFFGIVSLLAVFLYKRK